MRMASLIVAGIFFAILALVQFTRLYLELPIVVGNTPVPLWVSGIAFVVTSFLSIWMFISAKKG